MNAANLLKAMRVSLDLDIDTLANLLGYSARHVQAMESGTRPLSRRYVERWTYTFCAPTSAAELGLPE